MPVGIPLDRVCLRSGVYCSVCERKISEGRIEEWEIELLKALVDLEPSLGSTILDYVKAYRAGNAIVIVANVRGSVPVAFKERLARRLGVSDVVIVSNTSDIVRLAEELLYPLRVTGIDRSYLPDGTVETILRVEGDEPPRAWAVELFKELARRRLGTEVKIRYVPRRAGMVLVEKPDLSKVDRLLGP